MRNDNSIRGLWCSNMNTMLIKDLKKGDLVCIDDIIYTIVSFSICPARYPKRSIYCRGRDDPSKRREWIGLYSMEWPVYNGVVYLTENQGLLTKSAR